MPTLPTCHLRPELYLISFSHLDPTNEVVMEILEQDRSDQLWKKGKPNNEGYFSLENSKVPKFMTAISSEDLEVKGNITRIVYSPVHLNLEVESSHLIQLL